MSQADVHWSAKSDDDFRFCVASQFVDQIEKRLEELEMSYTDLAKKINRTLGRVSQFMNDPGDLKLSTMVRIVRVLGLKFTIVVYAEDQSRGIVEPVFVKRCWEHHKCPTNRWDVNTALGIKSVEE